MLQNNYKCYSVGRNWWPGGGGSALLQRDHKLLLFLKVQGVMLDLCKALCVDITTKCAYLS
jgi:hypothetical protein